MPDNFQELLASIKKLAEINNEDSDPVLEWMLKDTIQAILDYCRISKLPKQLEGFVKSLVMRQFNFENGDNINSIKRGDTTVSYGCTIGIEDFTDKDKRRLNAYRRFVMR
jgi:hypothetical protein